MTKPEALNKLSYFQSKNSGNPNELLEALTIAIDCVTLVNNLENAYNGNLNLDEGLVGVVSILHDYLRGKKYENK